MRQTKSSNPDYHLLGTLRKRGVLCRDNVFVIVRNKAVLLRDHKKHTACDITDSELGAPYKDSYVAGAIWSPTGWWGPGPLWRSTVRWWPIWNPIVYCGPVLSTPPIDRHIPVKNITFPIFWMRRVMNHQKSRARGTRKWCIIFETHNLRDL